MMTLQGLLLVWTSIALIWWIIAVSLVASRRRQPEYHKPQSKPLSVTIFKALAGPLTEAEFTHLSRCIETFVAELDEHSELIIGCHEDDQQRWQEFIENMRARFSKARLKLVADPDPGRCAANPKISWMQILAPHATGKLWFWSDSDIKAPPDTLQSLRSDFSSGDVQMLTSPYSIESVNSAPALLDALFVNLEFYPGVILLGKLNAIEFGFGAGMLFKAETFRQRVDWDFLGSCLADDYHLGRLLQPAKLGSMRLATTPAAQTWRGALLHYLRWEKTIRWSRPGGFGAQLLVLPVLGWLVALFLMPTVPFFWWGLLATLAIDIIAALLICHLLKCRIGVLRLPVIPAWSVIRCLTWLACWFPWPIVWRGRKWLFAFQTLSTPQKHMTNQRVEVKDVN